MKKTLLTILTFMLLVSCNTKKTSPIQSKPGISIMYIEDTSKLSIQEKNQIIIIQNQEEIIRNQENLLGRQGTEFKNQSSVLSNQGIMLINQESVKTNQKSMLINQRNVLDNQGTEKSNQKNILKKQDSIIDNMTDSTKLKKNNSNFIIMNIIQQPAYNESMYTQLEKIGQALKIQQKQIDSLIIIKMK